MKILILDPDSNRQRQLKAVLISLGHKTADISSAVDIKSGISAIRKVPHSLIFIISGIKEVEVMDFLYELKTNPLFQPVPIIIYGPSLTKANILSAREAGVNGFLAYPFTPSDVQDVITKVVGDKK